MRRRGIAGRECWHCDDSTLRKLPTIRKCVFLVEGEDWERRGKVMGNSEVAMDMYKRLYVSLIPRFPAGPPEGNAVPEPSAG